MKNLTVDSECKKYFKNPHRFASLLNATFFYDHPIDRNALALWDGEETNVVEEREKIQKSQISYRDLIMRTRIEQLPVLLALENQSKNDYSMVLRVQNYDTMNYLKQWDTNPNKPQNRFVLPVLTFVINWGQYYWHCDNTLADLSTGIPPSVADMFNDYKMNFFDVKDIDISRFEDEELKNAIDAVQRIYKLKEDNYQTALQGIKLNQESMEFVSVITNNEELYKQAMSMKEGEMKDMCDALDNVMKYVRNEGYNQGIALGYDQGIALGYDQGIALGYDKGFDKGVDKGVLQGRIMDVQQLMKNGNMNLTDAIRLLGINGHTGKQITQIIQSQTVY